MSRTKRTAFFRSTCGLLLLMLMALPFPARGQHGHKQKKVAPPSRMEKAPVIPKPDLLTLRYKPQVGTLIYNARTDVTQHVRDEHQELSGTLTSTAQLILHNVKIDYAHALWSFDRYFTKFTIYGHQLTGDSLALNEQEAVNKITRLTYKMTGEEVESKVIDTLRLLNTEAQTLSYFFQPPRLLIPLPKGSVGFGQTWSDRSVDTVLVHDTINIGVTDGSYVYDVTRLYKLAGMEDTMGHYYAVIVALDTGKFFGHQFNSVTNVQNTAHGPLTGTDTTYLDLFSGRVVKRTANLQIPAIVEVTEATAFTDLIDVRRVIQLDESNAVKLKSEE